MKIAVLVSGGVDSSVALALLKEAGHDVTAYYMKIWLEDELRFLGDCPWEEDLKYVRAVSQQFDVPLEIVPFQKEYWDRVVGYTLAEVQAGRTPNPDMLCNARVKFGAFYEYLEAQGKKYDKIATGHYAQTEERDGITWLKMSPDPVKDQTYFLSQLSQEQVARALFPIGGYPKGEVRRLAEKFQLPNAKRKDSQGICFLGKIPFDEFVKFHLGVKPGKLIEEGTGKVLGEHEGFWYYTIGQRKGIRLSGGPWYVTGKDLEKNEVYIAHGDRYQAEARDTFTVANPNWIAGSAPEKTALLVKIRHGEKMYPAEVTPLGAGRYRVRLAEKDHGIAAGQFAVFYDGDICLGGGVIEEEYADR
ncbi:MAG: tRNA 2-thiouridine(34) synthase MnmA [Candidatus Moranbacteria bacterium RIFCSPHIGHO2_01_FULL_55_24]|nr:MAG: tRNA 2-thiouridine(34) synthase MnmA [Candidatus Moranbacteria bacterium RIFCSPHIGHO2_01_FULL_55_24]